MFREINAMGMVLEEEDEMKLRYLTFAKTTPRTYGKSTYLCPLLRRGRSGYVVEALYVDSSTWYTLPSGLEDGLNPYFPIAILITKGKVCSSPALPRFLICTVGWECVQHSQVCGQIWVRHPRRFMFPTNVHGLASLCCGSKANGVPNGDHGRGSVPRQLEKAEAIEHIQALSLEMP